MQGRRSFFDEDIAFTPVMIQSPEETLDDFQERVKIRIEALDDAIRISHQLCESGLIKNPYEEKQLRLMFDTATKQLCEIGYFEIETDDFKRLTINSKRIRRALRSINTTPEGAIKLREELQGIREELELHFHFSVDSYIAYVHAIETLTNILTSGFLMRCSKLKKMNKIIENLCRLYGTGDILEDCDPSDRFSTLAVLNECKEVYGSLSGVRMEYLFGDNEDFSEGLDVANSCTNVFLFTKALTRYMITENLDLPEVARDNICPFKTSIIKIFK
jgi:hypothetical protein